ncbi:MAG: RsmB/NOP family class I SAM-dependent RNA methyltransferase [Candidatus Hodarchaeales archaeon]|jgi:NOL1/NOP2/sun family putative RNA methylase
MPQISQQAKKFGYNSTVIERWSRFFGEERVYKIINAFEKPIRPAIRINTIRENNPEILIKNLRKKGFKLEKQPNFSEFGYQILSAPSSSIAATTEYLLGKIQPQSLSSQLPVAILNPQKEETVGDFCASPGVKLSQIAQWMGNQGKIIGIEIATKRIQRLRSNLTRLGCSAIVLRMDAKEAPSLDIKFDRILVDAPCTGSGVIRKDSTRKMMRSSEVRRLSRIQFDILKSAVECLKSQGEIMYCTCSLELEENELVIAKILDKYPELSVRPLPRLYGVEKGLDSSVDPRISLGLHKTGRVYPDTHNEGFFLALLYKE